MNTRRFSSLMPTKAKPVRLLSSVKIRQFSASPSLLFEEEDPLQDMVSAETLSKIMGEYNFDDLMPQRVLVVQPNFMSGPYVRTNTKVEYMLEETYGLVKTLGWSVAGHMTFNVHHDIRLQFFGSGQMDKIKVREMVLQFHRK